MCQERGRRLKIGSETDSTASSLDPDLFQKEYTGKREKMLIFPSPAQIKVNICLYQTQLPLKEQGREKREIQKAITPLCQQASRISGTGWPKHWSSWSQPQRGVLDRLSPPRRREVKPEAQNGAERLNEPWRKPNFTVAYCPEESYFLPLEDCSRVWLPHPAGVLKSILGTTVCCTLPSQGIMGFLVFQTEKYIWALLL